MTKGNEMTDRELLESAAKAAGIPIEWGWLNENMARRTDTWETFDPLTEDGDALRLAVKLGIHITSSPTDAWATTLLVNAIEPMLDDHYAATRRAIVRAAAEIGKAME